MCFFLLVFYKGIWYYNIIIDYNRYWFIIYFFLLVFSWTTQLWIGQNKLNWPSNFLCLNIFKEIIIQYYVKLLKGAIGCKMQNASQIRLFWDSWQSDIVLLRPLPRLLIDSAVLAQTHTEWAGKNLPLFRRWSRFRQKCLLSNWGVLFCCWM